MHRYFIIFKPYQVLSQFSPHEGKKTLACCFDIPKNVYPAGRLDYDSEGLLILTSDPQVNHRLLNPMYRHQREYWVQVEGSITASAISALQNGVVISIDGKPHTTLPAAVTVFAASPVVWQRDPPIRFRKDIPVSWISLSLHEGKNRQVRRMTAKVGFPTLRLIRFRIEKLTLHGMQPGDIKELGRDEIYSALFA